MSKFYGDESRWDSPAVIWGAIALVCILTIVGNVIVWQVLRDPADASSSPRTSGPSGVGTDQDPASSDSLVDQCEARWHEQVAPIRAAETAIDQWRTHVMAMNDLVAGRISLSQATSFWNRTRIGAMHHIEQFQQAASRFQGTAADCAAHHALSMSGEDAAMGRCMHAIAVGDRLLAAADVAIRTWEHHVHHMEMLRRGEMTPAQATRMWISSWHAGNRQLHRYDVARRQALYVRCP